MAQLKILVELTVDCFVGGPVSDRQARDIQEKVEARLGSKDLASYLHGLGVYHDAEVIQVKYEETHDTRQ
jgi:hypothetical protein